MLANFRSTLARFSRQPVGGLPRGFLNPVSVFVKIFLKSYQIRVFFCFIGTGNGMQEQP